MWRGHPDAEAGVPPGALRGRRVHGPERPQLLRRLLLDSTAQLARSDVQQLLLEFGVISDCAHRADRARSRLAINNRRNVRLFAANVGFLGATSRLATLNRLLRHPASRSRPLSADHIPFLAEYVRERGRAGGGREWLTKHNIDRVERWERDGEAILVHISVRRDRRGDPAAGRVRLLLRHRRRRSSPPACSRCTRSGSTPTTTRSSPAASSTTTPSAGWRRWRCRCWPASTRTPSTSSTTTPARTASPSCCRRGSPTCWSTAARASPSAWPPTSRPTTSARSSTPPLHLIDNPEATPDDLMQFVKGPDFPTGALILGRAGDHRRLPHRPRLDPHAGPGRDRGDARRGTCDRRHRDARTRSSVAIDRRRRSPSWSTPASSTASATSTNVSAGRDTSWSSSSSATPTPTSCSTTSTSTRRCRPASA